MRSTATTPIVPTSRSPLGQESSAKRHRATLSSISDAEFLADEDGAFTFICPNVDVIFGYAPDEVQAMGSIAGLLGDDLFDRADLAARGEIRNVEREVTSKTGERRTVLVHLKRVSIQSATVLYTCRDITELKHARSSNGCDSQGATESTGSELRSPTSHVASGTGQYWFMSDTPGRLPRHGASQG